MFDKVDDISRGNFPDDQENPIKVPEKQNVSDDDDASLEQESRPKNKNTTTHWNYDISQAPHSVPNTPSSKEND